MLSTLRARRAAFWYLACDRIVAAVVSRTEREPMLESCAASYAAPIAGASFAAGVTEVAWVLGCERYACIAALAAPFCRIEQEQQDHRAEHASTAVRSALAAPAAVGPVASASARPGAGAGGERLAALAGAERGTRVWAHEGAVAEAASLFRRARLTLVALDCEPCALASLAAALGASDVAGARRQHLAAVSMLPECESAATAVGEDLAVPVALAISWFGAGRAR